MRKGYIFDTLTSVDIQEIDKNGGKVAKIYGGVIYRENIKISPIVKVTEKSFNFSQKYADECKDLMQGLVKLNMILLFGENVRKDIDEEYKCKSEYWTQTDYDENVLSHWKVPSVNILFNWSKTID